MQIRDFMEMKVHTITQDSTIKDLLITLHGNRLKSVPVVDKRNHLIGMVSEGDAIRYLTPKPLGFAAFIYNLENLEEDNFQQRKLKTKIKKIMTKKHLVSLSPADDFDEAVRLFTHFRFNNLPVINGVGRVIGLVERDYVMYNFAEALIAE